MQHISAIVLAGGKSRRMKENKALLPIAGLPLIQRLCLTLAEHFREIIVSVQCAEAYSFLPYPVVVDKEPDQGPMMGLLGGLAASSNPVNFVIACDIPEIDFDFVRRMADFTGDYEIVVPVSGVDKFEPLFAFYNKSVIPRIESLLQQQKRKIIELYSLAKVKTIPLDHAEWYYNLNSMDDYRRYLEKLSAGNGV